MSEYKMRKIRKQNRAAWVLIFVIFLSGIVVGGVIASAITHPYLTHKSEQTVQVATKNLSAPTTNSVSELNCRAHGEEPVYEEFTATAYCGCSKCCGRWAENRPGGTVKGAAGVELKQGVSIAADLSVMPIGTVVEIYGVGTFTVQDTGAAITGNKIDIYFENHDDAVEFGVKTVLLKIVK